MDRNELLALRCMFEGLTVEESIRVLGVQRSRAQYIRGKALRKLGTTCVIMAVRLLCAAGWNNEDEDHGEESDKREGSEDFRTYHA